MPLVLVAIKQHTHTQTRARVHSLSNLRFGCNNLPHRAINPRGPATRGVSTGPAACVCVCVMDSHTPGTLSSERCITGHIHRVSVCGAKTGSPPRPPNVFSFNRSGRTTAGRVAGRAAPDTPNLIYVAARTRPMGSRVCV